MGWMGDAETSLRCLCGGQGGGGWLLGVAPGRGLWDLLILAGVLVAMGALLLFQAWRARRTGVAAVQFRSYKERGQHKGYWRVVWVQRIVGFCLTVAGLGMAVWWLWRDGAILWR